MEQSSFSISPMSQTLSLVPGETYTGAITVINRSSTGPDLAFNVSVTPYSVVGQGYSADFATESPNTEITDWIAIAEPNGTIAPNASQVVSYSVSVPKDARPGGQYATIQVNIAESGEAAESGMVSNSYGLSSVLYGNVEGEAIHKGSILENIIPQFVTRTPLVLNAILENQGNTHEYATFSINITDALTDETVFTTEDKSSVYSEVIMPETTRLVTREVRNLPELGIVNITQTINYLGESSVSEHLAIICPIWFAVLIALTLVFLISGIILAVKWSLGEKRSTF